MAKKTPFAIAANIALCTTDTKVDSIIRRCGNTRVKRIHEHKQK